MGWYDQIWEHALFCVISANQPFKARRDTCDTFKRKKKKQLRHKNISPFLWYMQTLSHLFTFSQGSGLPPGLAKDYRAANMWKGGSAHCALM